MGLGKIIAALTAATLAAGAPPTLGAGAEQLSVVYAQASAAFTPLFAAQDQHFFAREGLEVRFTQITGSTAVATLVSGESQALAVGATEVADFDATGGDLVMVAAGSNYPVFSPARARRAPTPRARSRWRPPARNWLRATRARARRRAS